MRSIRLSLIVYFLLVLGAALGGVSWFCYRSTEQALDAKEESTTKVLKTRYEATRKQVETDFDRKLLERARRLADKLDGRAMWLRHQHESLTIVGLLNVPWQSQGYLPGLASLTPPAEGSKRFAFHRSVWTFGFRSPDDDMPPVEEYDARTEYFQINSIFNGRPLERSGNLDEWLPVDKAFVSFVSEPREVVDDIQIRPGPPTRRATLVVTMGKMQDGFVGRSFGFPFPPRKGPPGKDREPFRPKVIFQYASDTGGRTSDLAALEENLNRDLADLKENLRTHLADLRTNMLWIGLGAFVALVAGGPWLVRLGLYPLNRLSHAVRRVSPKDFRLQVTPQELPRELRPIAVCLMETLEQLRRAFAREKQTTADISHELRTPLATLLTNLDVALNKPRTPEQYREILEECRQSGRHMNQLVERLLTLARLDASAARIRPRPVDVSQLAEQCADLVRPLAKARGLDLRVHANGPAVLQADPDKLSEVLNNLLSNAVEYNRPNGSIDLTVGRDNGHLTVEVRDTGFGIAPDARDHIFERFFRADPSRHADVAHAGLGLAIVKEYIDLMGGTIGVQSSPAGSTFRVELPA